MNHRDLLPYAQVSYWIDGTAADKAEATLARIEDLGGGGWPRFEFKIPSQRSAMEAQLHALKTAFHRGELARSAAIRALL